MTNKHDLFYNTNQLMLNLTALKMNDVLTSKSDSANLNLDVLYKDKDSLIINLFEYYVFNPEKHHPDMAKTDVTLKIYPTLKTAEPLSSSTIFGSCEAYLENGEIDHENQA